MASPHTRQAKTTGEVGRGNNDAVNVSKEIKDTGSRSVRRLEAGEKGKNWNMITSRKPG